MASWASGSFSLPSELGQVRTWVLYELRGATRAECFFILHWGHHTLSSCGSCVYVWVYRNVPWLRQLQTQQLLLLSPYILRLLTPPLLFTLLIAPLLLEISVNSSSQHPCPDSLLLRRPALSLLLMLSSCLDSDTAQWKCNQAETLLLLCHAMIQHWHCLQGRLSFKCVWHGAITPLISFYPPTPPFSLSHSPFPSSLLAPQISSFVWKVTKQPWLIMLR